MKRRKIDRWIRFLIALIVSLAFFIPILMMLLGSFKSQGEVLALDLSLPKEFRFENYRHVLKTGGILRGYLNSFIITSGAVVLILLFGALTGIVISRRKGRASKLIYSYYLFGLTATMQMVTTYSLMIKLRLNGSYLGVILVFAAINLPFAVLTFSSFVTGVPLEIDEAARIDGAGAGSLVFRILLPIMKPVTVTNLIIAAIGVWNNFQVPLYLMSSSKRMTIPMTVFNFYGLYARDWQYVFAALTITILPVVILYLALQQYIVEGMTAGAVKG